VKKIALPATRELFLFLQTTISNFLKEKFEFFFKFFEINTSLSSCGALQYLSTQEDGYNQTEIIAKEFSDFFTIFTQRTTTTNVPQTRDFQYVRCHGSSCGVTRC
jgi:hypothetical protein